LNLEEEAVFAIDVVWGEFVWRGQEERLHGRTIVFFEIDVRELGELFRHGLKDFVVLWLGVNEAELHSHPAQIGVTKGFDEAGFVVVAAPLSEFPVEIEEAGFGAIAAPDFGELLYGLRGEEIVRVQVVGEEKWLSPKAFREFYFWLKVCVGHKAPEIATRETGSD
jgi:hypothetical protein